MMIKKIIYFLWIAIASVMTTLAYASLDIPMYSMQDNGKEIGYVRADDTIYGVLFTPFLHGLPSGIRGFHVHQCSSCAHQGKNAGDHLDLVGTGLHRGPYNGNSHVGDLPVLIVNAKGRAQLPVLAPRLKLENLRGRTLMIDAGGDNYSDNPAVNGGGIARIACGEVPYH